ncbi:MAG: hypothetical protein RIR00_355 [Pseudomonadota bacterium]|jgi:hypothetical protein
MNPPLNVLLSHAAAAPHRAGAGCAAAAVRGFVAVDQFINHWEINSSNRNSWAGSENAVFESFHFKTKACSAGTLRELERCGAAMGAVPH